MPHSLDGSGAPQDGMRRDAHTACVQLRCVYFLYTRWMPGPGATQERLGMCGRVNKLDAHNLGRQRLLKPRFFNWCGLRSSLSSTLCHLHPPQLKLTSKSPRCGEGEEDGGWWVGAAGGFDLECMGICASYAHTHAHVNMLCTRDLGHSRTAVVALGVG